MGGGGQGVGTCANQAGERVSGTNTVYSNGDASRASGDFAGAVDELDAALAVVAVVVTVVTDDWALL